MCFLSGKVSAGAALGLDLAGLDRCSSAMSVTGTIEFAVAISVPATIPKCAQTWTIVAHRKNQRALVQTMTAPAAELPAHR